MSNQKDLDWSNESSHRSHATYPLLLNFATAIMSASASDDIDKHVLRKYEIVSVSVYH
jgi:hypothetical protein